MTITERRGLMWLKRVSRMIRIAGLWLLGGAPREDFEPLRTKLDKAEQKVEELTHADLVQRSELVELERFIKDHGLGPQLYVARERKRRPFGRFWWEQKQKAR